MKENWLKAKVYDAMESLGFRLLAATYSDDIQIVDRGCLEYTQKAASYWYQVCEQHPDVARDVLKEGKP